MTYIYWLSQIQYAEQFLVGNNLFVLSQLLQRGLPILPGFVLGNTLWQDMRRNISQELSFKEVPKFSQDYKILKSIARDSHLAINQTPFPISRQTEIFQAAQQLNSANLILQPLITSPSGQFSRVNSLWRSHTCNNHPESLATAIKSVWSELFTATSLVYWHKLGLDSNQVNLSILVQPLKNSLASGMVEISHDLIQIKATWGLEQSLLQGAVEPDLYDLDRDTGYVLSQRLGHKHYGYRAKDLGITIPARDCIEAYIPEESLAATYVLNHHAIAQLQTLTQNILEQQPQITRLAWTALESQSSDTPDFYFTWIESNLTSNISTTETVAAPPSKLSSIPALLSGVPAAAGNVQAEVVVVRDFATHQEPIPPGSILVTKEINPQYLSLIKHTGGIITEIGGKTSHGAIVARELNIPAIVNVMDATKILHHGDQVLMNGDDGHIYPPTKEHQLSSRHSLRRRLAPAYPIATKLMVNLSQPETIASASNLPIDGIGLLRSELMLADFLTSQNLAQWQDSFREQFVTTLTNSLRQFTTAFAPRPVFYRSLDQYAQDTINPVLGSRGAYDYLTDPTLFDLQLTALRTIIAEGNPNLNLILPFIRSLDEFKFCYRRIENAGLTMQSSFQVWIMAEVPSVIMLLPEYIKAGVQGIAIGTNDLTQLLLGVNREHTQFSDRGLNASHPAMQKAIAELIKTAHEHQIECCICGQAPVDYPDLIDQLIQWGIDTISVEPDAVHRTYKAIARAERRILLAEIRSKE